LTERSRFRIRHLQKNENKYASRERKQ
jgi:hypothetical protein